MFKNLIIAAITIAAITLGIALEAPAAEASSGVPAVVMKYADDMAEAHVYLYRFGIGITALADEHGVDTAVQNGIAKYRIAWDRLTNGKDAVNDPEVTVGIPAYRLPRMERSLENRVRLTVKANTLLMFLCIMQDKEAEMMAVIRANMKEVPDPVRCYPTTIVRRLEGYDRTNKALGKLVGVDLDL